MAVEREGREKMKKKEGTRPNKERGKRRDFWSTVLFDYSTTLYNDCQREREEREVKKKEIFYQETKMRKEKK